MNDDDDEDDYNVDLDDHCDDEIFLFLFQGWSEGALPLHRVGQ